MTKLTKIAAFAVPACATLAFAQPASAVAGATATVASAASPASVQAKAPAATRVCVNVVPDTGSRMARRICKTQTEWADEGVDLNVQK
jgi:hypothetical protein